MINQLTLHQLHTYIKDNVSTCIVEDHLYNNRRVLYTIKIAGIQFSTSFSLYDILCNINADWNTAAINNIVDAFNTYILNRISDDDYKKLIARNEAKSTPYSVLHFEIVDLSKRLISMEEEFDQAMKSLGNMYDDEERAREQLDEIQEFLKECKKKIRCYKLPVVPNKYFVELNEANDAIEEKTAELAEMAIVYGNRYRSVYSDIDVGLQESESMFYKGNYKNSLDKAIKTIQIVEEDIYTKLLKIYDRG